MLAAKKRLIPNQTSHNPSAIKDNNGNMITSPDGIKKFSLKEILLRLRHIRIHPDLNELQSLKERLCKERLNITKHKKSKHWTLFDLKRVLKSLKSGKCRDPQGYIN